MAAVPLRLSLNVPLPQRSLLRRPSHSYSHSLLTSSSPALHCRRRPRPLTAFCAVSSSPGALSQAQLLPVVDATTLPPEPGVYAIYDADGELQFVGISRNVAASVAAHRKFLAPELVSSVKVAVLNNPDRAALTGAWKTWMEEHIQASGKVPPGNESGNTTWVRRPEQRKAKSDLRLTPGPNTKLTVPLEELIDQLVKEKVVVAFIKGSRSAPQCGFSQRVVGILESLGVDYESVNVLDEEYNNGLRESLKRYSNWPTFPQVFVKGELLGGCDIITSMAESGELAKLFGK